MVVEYIFLLLSSVSLAYISGNGEFRSKRRMRRYTYLLLIVILVLFAASRYLNYFGTDEYNYRMAVSRYMRQEFSIEKLALTEEPLFYILSWVCANVFHSDQMLIIITATVTNILIIHSLKKHAPVFWFAIFLYIASGIYFYTFAAVRQYLAAAIIFSQTESIINQNLKKYFFAVFVASLFHFSAWIMLVPYFLMKSKKMDKLLLVIIICAVVVWLSFDNLLPFLVSNTSYANYIEIYITNSMGMRFERVLAWSIAYILIFIKSKEISLDSEKNKLLLIMTMLSFACYIMALAFAYIGRVEIYFGLFAICAVCFVPFVFERHSRKVVIFLMLLLYFLYGLYDAYTTYPYISYFFTVHNTKYF